MRNKVSVYREYPLEKYSENGKLREWKNIQERENYQGKSKPVGKNMDLEQEKTLYGSAFHRNICWQRSYEKAEGKEIVMALYGSLRNELYNSRRFDLPNRSEFLGKTRINGYALYPLGPYPAVYPSENSSVVAEVRRFSGKQQLEIAKSIDYMELFGGYHREYVDLEIEKQKIRGFIYVYDEKPEAEKIEHGDWVHYLREKGEKN
ncbi:MAG: gamma-glutamylcyclotransferase family protein [Methanosarcina sp.]|uniref:gamma-glutamylcyclotransferase family protein n=1 Tax=Methanosarcina sp. TaxID=2213 RepID=UPI003BB4F474